MKAARLTDEQKLDWLHLIRCENIGPRTFRALIRRHGDASAALRALPISSGRARAAPWSCPRATLFCGNGSGPRGSGRASSRSAIALCEPDYPPALRAIDAPPPLLAVRGDLALLQKPMAALVGSRNASAAGLAMTERLARGLGAAAFVVVSGLARGIDACAHRASLATSAVGVLAGGLDRPCPPENLPLLD